MGEQFCEVGRGVTICFEEFGDRSDPTILLVMGLATQMIAWEDEFCAGLARRGYHVIRFDNRDIGLSTELDFAPPKLGQILTRRFGPEQYRLSDMAEDAIGLLDALAIDSAHVAGASMGGMIAQLMAIDWPRRVRSLTSIMSNTGSRITGQPAPQVYRRFLAPYPHDREARIEHTVRLFEQVGSRGELRDLDRVREMATKAADRSFRPAGNARQLGAVLASPNRTSRLREVDVPTTVIHGNADRLVNKSGGRATADAVPGARLVTVDQMGHDMPPKLWPRLIDLIAATADRAESGTASARTANRGR